MLVFVGVVVGLAFLLGGTSGALSRIRTGMQSLRIRRNGMNIEAEILRSQPLSTGRGGRPSSVLIAGQWEWGSERYKGEFTVPGRWWDEREGTSIAVRIDPNRPGVAELTEESPNPSWAIVLAIGWLIMAVVGAIFLVQSATTVCDPVEYDFLVPVCESLGLG